MRSNAEDEDNWVYRRAKKMFKEDDWFLDMLQGQHWVMIGHEIEKVFIKPWQRHLFERMEMKIDEMKKSDIW